MRTGDANRSVRVSSIFHSKRLNNDGAAGCVKAISQRSVMWEEVEQSQWLAIRLLFATRDLGFGKHLGVLGPRIEAKLKCFPRLDPRCRRRPR